MRNLYLIRHGSPDFPKGIKLCIGRTNIDLGQAGMEECAGLRLFFQEKNISNIYASPLIRAVHTGEIIADGKVSVVTHPDLMEIDMGCWEGLPLKSIKKELGDEPFDGEKRVDALDRFEKAIKEILASTVGDVICVAHAGVNCAFVAKVMGAEIRTSRGIKQPCGCYNHFQVDDNMNFKVIEFGVLPETGENQGLKQRSEG
ncbi:MAG: histidine phosphatase family protein [Anaerovoracaceae bacterium]